MDNSRRGTVVLTVEIPDRELLVYQVLSRELNARGYNTRICSYTELNRVIHELHPAVVVHNASRKKEHFYPYFYGTRHLDYRIVDLVWEQPVTPRTMNIQIFKDGFGPYYLDLVTAWGPAYKQHFYHQGVPEDRVAVTGAPKQALIQMARSTVDKRDIVREVLGDAPAGRPVVMIATTFAHSVWDAARIERYRKNIRDDIERLVEWARYFQAVYCRLLADVTRRYPDIFFLLRPHPSKAAGYAESYLREIDGRENVAMVQDGDFTWPLLASDLVIATRSTTLVDAYVAGIPALNLLDHDYPEVSQPLFQSPYGYFGRMVTSEQVLASLPALLNPGPQPDAEPLAREWFRDWINPDGLATFQRTADAIEYSLTRPRNEWLRAPFTEAKWRWVRRRQRGRLRPSEFHSAYPRLDEMLISHVWGSPEPAFREEQSWRS